MTHDANLDGSALPAPGTLADLYREWGPLVHTFAVDTFGDGEDATELTRTTFVTAWREHQASGAGGPLPPALLLNTVRRIAAEVRHDRYLNRRDAASVIDAVLHSGSRDEDVMGRLGTAFVLDRVDGMPGTVLRLVLAESHELDSIARILGVSVETVHENLRIGIFELSHLLEELGL